MHRILEGKKIHRKPEGAARTLEVGNRRLYTIAHVRQQLDMHSRDVFKETPMAALRDT